MDRNCIELEVKMFAGTSIENACKQSVELANKLDVCITFKFNGVLCMANSTTNADKLVEAWNEQMDSKSQYKIAVAH